MATEPRVLPGIGLTGYLPEGATWKTEMDANLIKASVVIQLTVLDRVTAIPGSPSHGDTYILTDTPHNHAVATYDEDHWTYITPNEGWKAYVLDESADYIFDGADWAIYDPGAGALDSDLTDIAALTPSNDDIMQRKAGHWTNRTLAQLATDLALAATYQPLDSDLTAIAGLTPTNDDIIQRKGGAWVNRTIAQLTTDLTGLQPIDSDLTAIAAIAPSNDDIIQRKAGAWTNRTMAQLATDLVSPLSSSLQPIDSDLTAIAALTPTNDDVIQRKAGAWTNRTIAQLQSDLGITGGGGSYVAKAGDTMSGGLTVPAGSAGTPGLSINGQGGIFSSGSNSISLVAATTEIVRLATTGLAIGTGFAPSAVIDMRGTGLQDISLRSANNSAIRMFRYSGNTAAASLAVYKGRGDLTTPVVPSSGDFLGIYFFGGYVSGSVPNETIINSASIALSSIETSTWDATHAGTKWALSVAAIGSGNPTEVERWEAGTGLSMYTVQTIDQNRVWHVREYTVGTKPSTTGTGIIQLSDEGGGKALAMYDSVAADYRRVDDNQIVSATAAARGLIARFPTRQDRKYRTLVMDTFQKIEDAGLMAKLKGLWVHAVPTQAIALMNWVNSARDMVIIGTPTFTANIGFTGNGTDSILDTNASLVTYATGQNDIAFGTYVRTASASSKAVAGQIPNTVGRRHFLESDTTGTLQARIQSGSGINYTVSKYTGMFTMNRTGSANADMYLDDALVASSAAASTSTSGERISFLGVNDSTGSEFSTAQVSFSFLSLGLTATEIRKLRSIMVDFYLVKLGAVTASWSNKPPAADFTGEWYYFPDLFGSGKGGMAYSDGTNWIAGTYEEITIQYSDMTTAITTGTAKAGRYFARKFACFEVISALIGSAGTVTAHVIDVNKNGTTIFSTNPSIAATTQSSIAGGSTAAVISGSLATFDRGDIATIDVDSIATGAKGGQAVLCGYYL